MLEQAASTSAASALATNTPRIKARMPEMDWVKYRIFRLEMRSAMTPPYGPRIRMGRYCNAVVMPRAVPEFVSLSTSQAWAIDCIKVPEVEMICPI